MDKGQAHQPWKDSLSSLVRAGPEAFSTLDQRQASRHKTIPSIGPIPDKWTMRIPPNFRGREAQNVVAGAERCGAGPLRLPGLLTLAFWWNRQ